MAEIRLNKLVKRYENGFEAVKGIDLQIEDGEFLVLVGPSGCGKSTTLRMIAGLEEVSAGEIYIGDRKVNDLEPGDRDIAMVFQNYALYPHMTVRQNMSFGLKMRKTPKAEIEQRVAQAAEILTITDLLDRKPAQLSGGQRQRVAVGRAIVRNPLAFLFDEPLSNLDAKLRVQMRTELARLHNRLKTTTVYVTHDQVEAMTLGDRIVVMKDGVVQQFDTPLEIYRRPANRFVAGFIGSPAMNFIEGRVSNGVFAAGADGSGFEFSLDGATVGDGSYVFGFRPEHVCVDDSHPALASASLEVVERMGHETVAYFSLCDSQVVATFKGDAEIGEGDVARMFLPQENWYLYSTDEQGSLVATGLPE
ncbi:MAG: sn-glycerol-3-phosphate ABC transporter ATP-binding protein UgpC [Planctomycetota bacterium]